MLHTEKLLFLDFENIIFIIVNYLFFSAIFHYFSLKAFFFSFKTYFFIKNDFSKRVGDQTLRCHWFFYKNSLKPLKTYKNLYKTLYAHIKVVVAFLVVNFFGFLVIARNPPNEFWRKLVEILPPGLPELSKPSRNLPDRRKTKIFRRIFFRDDENN